MGDRDVRQLDVCGLRQRAGRHGVPLPLLIGHLPSEVDGESRRPPRCEVSTRAVQCSGRSPQPSGSSYGTGWSLHPQVTRALFRAWSFLSLDLFVTSLNAKLPRYCSLVLDPQVVFEDALLHPWDNLDIYAFPPFPLVGRVVAQVRETPNLSIILVAPLWPEKEWFVGLHLLLTQPHLTLPWWDWLLRQPHFNQFLHGFHALSLHAWRLSSRAFREDLLLRCRLRQNTRFPRVPGQVDALLWLVLWKERCSSQRYYSPRRDFLVRLCRDRDLSVSAVKDYQSALNLVFALKGMDLADSCEISMLLRRFLKSARPEELRPSA